MEVVKTIERLGNSSGKPAAQVRITDCGITSPPARAAAVPASPPAAAAGSKRPAESCAANAGKKVNAGDKSPSAVEGIDNPEKNQKKIQLASGLEYVDIKVRDQYSTRVQSTLAHCVGAADTAAQGWHGSNGVRRQKNCCWVQRRAQGAHLLTRLLLPATLQRRRCLVLFAYCHRLTRSMQNGFKEFDRSANFNFRLGVGEVIKGWDEGCKGMREGGVRRLLVPSHLGYGRQGAGKDIPPNADLVFEVSLKRVL